MENRYVALGTDKFLLIYFEGQLFDITPLKTSITGATLSTNSTTTVTITTSAAHGMNVGDIVLFDSVRLTSTTGFPSPAGTIAVGNELITYTGVAGNELTGITRGALGTATAGTSNGQAHSDEAVVTNAN